jgi:hypothetical protein
VLVDEALGLDDFEEHDLVRVIAAVGPVHEALDPPLGLAFISWMVLVKPSGPTTARRSGRVRPSRRARAARRARA